MLSTPPLTHFYSLQDWIDTGGSVVCACTTVCTPHLCVSNSFVTAFLNPNPPRARSTGKRWAVANDGAVLQCARLNVKLIFNVWHFTQIIRPQTWPWGIPQIAFSVPQQLWNYSSQREQGEWGGGERLWVWRNDRPLAALAIPDCSSLSFSLSLCDIMIAELFEIENILAVWRLYEITIYYV